MEPPREQLTLIRHPRSLEQPEFDLNEWSRMRLENTRRRRRSSRRYSASFVGTFRENDDEPVNKSPELRLALNSKWSEAERYICNPLSGEVPLECLSAKTLSGRSFHQFASRISTSTPVIHPLPPRHLLRKSSIAIHEDGLKFPTTQGNENSPPVMDSSHPSPVTPSIEERVIQRSRAGSEDSLESSENRKFDGEVEMEKDNEEEQGGEIDEGENEQNGSKKTTSTARRGGCFPSWITLWKKRNHESNNTLKTRKKIIFLFHKIICLRE